MPPIIDNLTHIHILPIDKAYRILYNNYKISQIIFSEVVYMIKPDISSPSAKKHLIDEAYRYIVIYEDYYRAQICCKLILQNNKNSFAANYLMGCALYLDGQLEKARLSFSKAIKLNPKSQNAKINKGVVECQMGRLSGFKEVTKIRHDYAHCYRIFELEAIYSAQRHEYDLAETYFEKAKDFINKPSIYTNHGTALLEKYLANEGTVEDLHKALSQFNYAIANSNFDKYAYYNRCRTYILLKEYKNALSDARKLAEYDEKDPGFLYILAKAQMLCGLYDEAAENAIYAHWYGTLFNLHVAEEALELCNEIAETEAAALNKGID